MPEIRSLNHLGSLGDVTQIGSTAVSYFESLLTVGGNHTLEYTNDSVENFVLNVTRDPNPTTYTRSHRIFSKVTPNGNIYLEIYNLFVEVPAGSSLWCDTQFLCFAVGTGESSGTLLNGSTVFALPLDWSVSLNNLPKDYSSDTDHAISELYDPDTKNTRFYVADSDTTTGFGWVTRETDSETEGESILNAQFAMCGTVDHPNYSLFLIPNVSTDPSTDSTEYSSALTSTFAGVSGYYKPTVSFANVPDVKDVHWYDGSWTVDTVTDKATQSAWYTVENFTFERNGKLPRFVKDRSIVGDICFSADYIVDPSTTTPTSFYKNNPFILSEGTYILCRSGVNKATASFSFSSDWDHVFVPGQSSNRSFHIGGLSSV